MIYSVVLNTNETIKEPIIEHYDINMKIIAPYNKNLNEVKAIVEKYMENNFPNIKFDEDSWNELIEKNHLLLKTYTYKINKDPDDPDSIVYLIQAEEYLTFIDELDNDDY